MSRGHFIGLNHHRLMLADKLRMQAYERAIAARVKPGMTVLDLGTGTGILALWAARAGANVIAVEPHAVIGVARRIAEDNGLSDRIRFIRADAKTLELGDADKVDLVVTECMGNFFVTDEMQPVLRDLPRHMKASGETLPRRITLHLAGATLPLWRELAFWEEDIGGFDYSAALDFASQAAYVVFCEPEFIITETAKVSDFELTSAPDTFSMETHLAVKRSGTVHGLVGWFDADLADGVILSTAPGQRTHWGQMVFPLPPTPVKAGDRLEVTLTLAMDESLKSYFRWEGRIVRDGDSVEFACDTRQRFGGES